MINKLHRDFGVELEYDSITHHSELINLIKQYGLVIINKVPFCQDKDKIFKFATEFGRPVPIKRFDNTPVGELPYFFGTEFGVSSLISNPKPQLRDLQWHQDGSCVFIDDSITFATNNVVMSPGEKTQGTAFASTQTILSQLSNPFRQFLSGLELKQEFNGNKSLQLKIQEFAYNNINKIPNDKILEITEDLKKYYVNPTMRPLISYSQWLEKEFLVFSPDGIQTLLGIRPEESKNILNFLETSMVTPGNIYLHDWKPNQIIIWDNMTLMHSAATNTTTTHTRELWRIQVLV